MNVWLKYAITATVVVLASEAAKRSDRLGGLVASLPLVTLLTLVWLHVERQGAEKIANHAFYTFWYVAAALPFFLLFPLLMPRLGFGWALAAATAITLILFFIFSLALARFGIRLL